MVTNHVGRGGIHLTGRVLLFVGSVLDLVIETAAIMRLRCGDICAQGPHERWGGGQGRADTLSDDAERAGGGGK
eukprot:4273356-Pyramimonas_sp.AAC.1